MDERFELVKQAPASALRQISAGRLRGKSDINPQWKIEAMTAVYGMCGLGWKYEVAWTKEVELQDGQKMLYMQVNLYIRDTNGEWSAPIIGMGGDFLVKSEQREGLRANDEAYKMCLTDALGNAMKNIGIASDIYRGLWDGSKYKAIEDEVLKKKEEKKEERTVITGETEEYVKNIDGKTCIRAKNGQYYPLERFTLEQLNSIVNDKKFAACHSEARELLSHLG